METKVKMELILHQLSTKFHVAHIHLDCLRPPDLMEVSVGALRDEL